MEILIRIGPLKKYRKQIQRDIANTDNGPVRKAMKKWASRYRRFLSKRYTRASHGSGIWRPLKAATIARKGHKRILIETGALRKALRPTFGTTPGQLDQNGSGYIIVGYSRLPHPTAGMTLSQLAQIHQLGLGNVPQRKIIVRPDRATVQLMVQDMEDALVELGRKTGVQPR